jgi:hypothetical protein
MLSACRTVPSGLPASPCRTVKAGHQLADNENRVIFRNEICLLRYVPGTRIGICADFFFRESEDFVACCAEFIILALIVLTLVSLYLVVQLISFHDHRSLSDEQVHLIPLKTEHKLLSTERYAELAECLVEKRLS